MRLEGQGLQGHISGVYQSTTPRSCVTDSHQSEPTGRSRWENVSRTPRNGSTDWISKKSFRLRSLVYYLVPLRGMDAACKSFLQSNVELVPWKALGGREMLGLEMSKELFEDYQWAN